MHNKYIRVFKPLIYLLLFNISLGILLPSLTLLNDNLIESAIIIVNLEGELELEEKETEKKIFEEETFYLVTSFLPEKNFEGETLKSQTKRSNTNITVAATNELINTSRI